MSTPTLTKDHCVTVFATHQQAEAAIKTLQSSGFDMKNLSIIGQNYQTEEHPVGFINSGDRMRKFGTFGAFWGTVWGVLFGSAFLVVPGFGPVVLAGYIISALEGALVGGGLGVIGGALMSVGVPKDSVVGYETALKAGNFLLIANGTEAEVHSAQDILGKMSPVDAKVGDDDGGPFTNGPLVGVLPIL